MKQAILRAGVQRQWIMSQTAPGAIAARQQARDHVVEVRINYSASGYSIHYVSSSNMLASRWEKSIKTITAGSTIWIKIFR
ncbi:Uncharacterised protein [Raoultella planticola]|uniref:Uncharacterized protein n=1 Tax=Raoultella planticola TaxID=575 RepID=A0A485B832_RAOPL|nr:Uncharacterised protein [Raoultella planticola]